jgi:hypothetical protein
MVKIMYVWIWIAAATIVTGYNNAVGISALTTSGNGCGSKSMWEILHTQEPSVAFRTIFGPNGERGEYMDGYSRASMAERCRDDYHWTTTTTIATTTTTTDEKIQEHRASMMSHLYDCEDLWKHVSMVAFAEHYVLTDAKQKQSSRQRLLSKPFETFRLQQASRPSDEPIFGGVVYSDWEQQQQQQQQQHDSNIEEKLAHFSQRGIHYIRLECNLGSIKEIGEPSEIGKNKKILHRLSRLARAAKACQQSKLVPVVLLQMPWREQGVSTDYFRQACKSFVSALTTETVDPRKLVFETRPPVGLSARAEAALSEPERIALGWDTGKTMFEVFEELLNTESSPFAGYCVAGGSTKGAIPTAMQDDTQNAVRQGLREASRERWGHEFCFWEMGAKLMLQPQVGRLWGEGRSDEARELFCANARDMAGEIVRSLERT